MSGEQAQRPVNSQTVSTFPAEHQRKIQEVREILQRATQYAPVRGPERSAGNADPNHASRQKAHHQDAVQHAMSPTDNSRGKTASQAPAPARQATPARQGQSAAPARSAGAPSVSGHGGRSR